MRNLWIYISNLGKPDKSSLEEKRVIILSNQMNFIMLVTMLVLVVATVIIILLIHMKVSIGTLRVGIMALLSFINLLLARFGFTKLSTLSLIFLPPVVFLLGPTLIGYVEEESYTYYPYTLIAVSIIPQLIFRPDKQKFLFWSGLIYYFILVVIIDKIMMIFSDKTYAIESIISGFYPFYKLAQIVIFLFINICINYLRKLNVRFEKHLNQKNQILDVWNKELAAQRQKILQQKNLIEQKSQSIRDSIQYASRIQSAVLLPQNFLTEWGIDNFIYYRPKDVVSGDFYWGVKWESKIIVAAVDCTGHGVPGAFMSMLGHAFLDEIINTKEVTDAASILNFLRDEVINTLRQKGNAGEARDGMDISLCIIDRESGKLDFAGANNPLYLIRDENLTIIQGDRMPIGIYLTAGKPFTNKTTEIRKGDYLYLFSDGYADQFGGRKGKKYMFKNFQQLLLRNHYKPMQLQREILDNTFEKWRGEHDQLDDVLVIGLHL
jgi:serine phosphatase RsbU (regulator of sigma subunit)